METRPRLSPMPTTPSVAELRAAARGARATGKAARRSRVIETAMVMANEGGYEAVQMRAVAERAGVSLGTIYRYFNGKDDLLLSPASSGGSVWCAAASRRHRSRARRRRNGSRRCWPTQQAAEHAPVLMARW
ncbi:MAG: TetR family transcriptional regulator [Acidimicrobiales bacterium]